MGKLMRAPEECWIWLIWGLKKDCCDLLAIASSEKTRDRYVEYGNRHGYQHVQAEEVMTGHLYGANMRLRPVFKTFREHRVAKSKLKLHYHDLT